MKKNLILILFLLINFTNICAQISYKDIVITKSSDFNSTTNKLSRVIGRKPSISNPDPDLVKILNVKEYRATWILNNSDEVVNKIIYQKTQNTKTNEIDVYLQTRYEFKNLTEQHHEPMFQKLYNESVKKFGKQTSYEESGSDKVYKWVTPECIRELKLSYVELMGLLLIKIGEWHVTMDDIPLK